LAKIFLVARVVDGEALLGQCLQIKVLRYPNIRRKKSCNSITTSLTKLLSIFDLYLSFYRAALLNYIGTAKIRATI